MPRYLCVAFSLLTLTACASPYTVQSKFNASQVEWSRKSGDATVKGQAFLKTVGGDVKTCAGNLVRLVPESSYAAEIYAAYLVGQTRQGIANPDNSQRDFQKTTLCDSQGNFAFKNLPAGKWIIEALVRWQVPSGYLMLNQGGNIMDSVTTRDHEESDVIITK